MLNVCGNAVTLGGGGGGGVEGAAMISAGQVDFLAETDENGNKTKRKWSSRSY